MSNPDENEQSNVRKQVEDRFEVYKEITNVPEASAYEAAEAVDAEAGQQKNSDR